MIDIRQSSQYAHYLELLGWKVEKIDGCCIFIRQFPLLGSIIKIQRPEKIPPVEEIKTVAKKYRSFQILIEPREKLRNLEIEKFRGLGFRSSFPSLPSKTLCIDLTKPEEQIFAHFSSVKRRAIRRAIKNKVIVKESDNIEQFIKLKNSQNGFSGRILKVNKQFNALWQAFRPKKAALLLAYQKEVFLGGVLLLFHDRTAYYSQAASTKKGNRLAAPSLLVWEALKLAKKKGCKIFDFEGIFDSRYPQKSWLGFSRFKKGFGEKEIIYPSPLVKTSLTVRFGSCYD